MTLLSELQRPGTILYQVAGLNYEGEQSTPPAPILGFHLQMTQPTGPPIACVVIGVFRPDETCEPEIGFILELLPLGIVVGSTED